MNADRRTRVAEAGTGHFHTAVVEGEHADPGPVDVVTCEKMKSKFVLKRNAQKRKDPPFWMRLQW